MPRGVRKQPVSLENQIAEVTDQIKQLQDKKKKLLAEKEQQDINLLMAAVKESGLTPEELVAKLKSLEMATPVEPVEE
jgi:NAD-specific glutamate dehydrogenase